MFINSEILRRETIQLVREIEEQIQEVKDEAHGMGIPTKKLRDGDNNWVMIPLLQAKAQAYSTLVLLQVKKES